MSYLITCATKPPAGKGTLFGQGLCVHLWTNWAFQHYQKRNLSVFQKQRNESNSFAEKRGG